MSVFLLILLAFIIDRMFGEPRVFHPLVGFGKIALKLEKCWNTSDRQSHQISRVVGLVAMTSLIFPVCLLVYFASSLGWLIDVLILTLAIGWQSLREHTLVIHQALVLGDINQARQKIKLIVSRDTQCMNSEDVSKACVESILENGSDAIFAAVFWFIVAGAPGVVVYRLINTLDAMWGYKNSRFNYFGWAAARADDIMNYIPARLTALSYFFVSRKLLAIRCWYRQAPLWKSPNAGPVMAAGAGSLGILLGGAAVYDGKTQFRPVLGVGRAVIADDIMVALNLVSNSILLWLVVILFFTMMIEYVSF